MSKILYTILLTMFTPFIYASDMGALNTFIKLSSISAILVVQCFIVTILAFKKFFISKSPALSYVVTGIFILVFAVILYPEIGNTHLDDLIILLGISFVPAITAILVPWVQYTKYGKRT